MEKIKTISHIVNSLDMKKKTMIWKLRTYKQGVKDERKFILKLLERLVKELKKL